MKAAIGASILAVAIGLVIMSVANGRNYFHEDPNCRMLFRFEDSSHWWKNSVEPNHLSQTNTPTRNTANEPEGSSWSFHDDGDYHYMTDANHPDCWDGGDFTFCGWFKGNQWWSSTYHWLIRKQETNKNCFDVSVYDSGTVEHIRVRLGYNNGDSWDTYDHGYDLGTGTLYWVGVSVDVDANIVITVYYEDTPKSGTPSKMGTDIDTPVLNTLNDEDPNWTIGGVGAAMFFDEFVFFDRALSDAELYEVVASKFGDGNNTTFYCDGDDGWLYATGGSDSPWPKLETTLDGDALSAYVSAGDTIKLDDAVTHGTVDFGSAGTSKSQMSNWVDVEPNGTDEPNIVQLIITDATYWRFHDILFSYECSGSYPPVHDPCNIYGYHMVQGTSGQDQNHLDFFNCTFQTVDDADAAWSDSNDWTVRAWGGISPFCDVNVVDCTFRNLSWGLTNLRGNTGRNVCRIIDNDFNGVIWDVIMGANGSFKITGNCMYNLVDDNDNSFLNPNDHHHGDMIQLSPPAHYQDVLIEDNWCVVRGDANDFGFSSITHGWHQGFFLTGFIDSNYVVQNNLVGAMNAAYAISIGYDAYDVDVCDIQVYNNTVVHPWGINPQSGNLYFSDQGGDDGDYGPDGNEIRDSIYIANNLLASWPTGSGITAANNYDTDLSDINNMFVDYDDADFNLPSGSVLVDEGTADYNEPADDIGGTARDATPDVGAYEYDAPSEQGYIIIGWIQEKAWYREEDYLPFFYSQQ